MTLVGNVLSADSLAGVMASALPQDASPQLKTAYDAIALASHSSMVAVGFRLIGLGDDDRLAESQSTHLPQSWNASAPNYAFRYAHNQSSMEYLLKVNRMGNKAVVLAMALGDDKTATFDVKVADYISESALPFTLSQPVNTSLFNLFISNGRLSDFGSLMRINVVQKLMPSLQKEGYQESVTNAAAAARPSAREPDNPRHDPLREDRQPPARPQIPHDPLSQPRRPFPQGDFPPPGFEDEYDMTRPPRPMTGPFPGFGNIGERDLYPQGLGPRDPFTGGAGSGFGGGMHPTLSDLYGGQGSGNNYDPQAPPGSRYDPVGPGGAPRGNGGGGFPGNGLGRPPNPFGGFGGNDFI